MSFPFSFWKAASVSNITSDIWQNFQVAPSATAFTGSNLLANAHSAGTETWVVLSGAPTSLTAASKNLISTITSNGTLYTDTSTLGADCNVNSSWRIKVTLASPVATQSFGFWFMANPNSSGTFITVFDATNNNASIVQVRQTNTSGVIGLTLQGSTASSSVTVDGTSFWYVTATVTNAGTCKMTVKNASGVQQGVEVTCVGNTQTQFDSYIIGAGTNSTSGNGEAYYSGFWINTATALYPQGP